MGKRRSSRLSHLSTNDENAAANKNQTLAFGNFPAEIRNQIYRYVLLEDRDMYPYLYEPYDHFEGLTWEDRIDESWSYGQEGREVDIEDPVIHSQVHQIACLKDRNRGRCDIRPQ